MLTTNRGEGQGMSSEEKLECYISTVIRAFDSGFSSMYLILVPSPFTLVPVTSEKEQP